ncbi:MAG: peptidase C45, partial [Gammaproteobacteria bacterium]
MNQLHTETLTTQERGWLEKAKRTDRDGWIHLRIAGEPFERGFQHGYLTAREYAEAMRVYQAMTFASMGLTYDFFVESAAKYHL